MKNGLFITIEGTDGAGKSTQLTNVISYFEDRGIRPLVTREPGGTEIGEKFRDIILDKSNFEMCSMTETLLYAAARAQLVEEKIKPALNNGKVVICDRYIDSSIAYQGAGREMGDCVAVINDYAINGLKPNLTFFLDIDPEIAKSRIEEGEQDRIESEKLDFHYRVYNGYLKIYRENKDRVVRIDAARDIETVKKDIYNHLDRITLQIWGKKCQQ